MARIAAVVVALAVAGVLANAISAPAEATNPRVAHEVSSEDLDGVVETEPEGLPDGPPEGLAEVLSDLLPEDWTEAVTDGTSPSALAAVRTKHPQAGKTRSQDGKSTKAKAKRGAHRASVDPHLTHPDEAEATPAHRYGQLSQTECEAELAARHIDFIRETASHVLAPVRLTGPLHGVVFRSDARDKVRATSPYEIADCRLVLALDDFAAILSRHDIVEVRHYSMYRPAKSTSKSESRGVGSSPVESMPDGEIGTRHPGALAIDVGRLHDRSGGELDVDRDFHGAIGDATCGEGAAPRVATEAALALRAILCEAVDAHLFNVVLTPNYNRPHKNHFHLEITAGVTWFLVH